MALCGNCKPSTAEEEERTKCTACKRFKTRGYAWTYCEGCAEDLGCCEDCGDMVFEPRRPDLARDLGIKSFWTD